MYKSFKFFSISLSLIVSLNYFNPISLQASSFVCEVIHPEDEPFHTAHFGRANVTREVRRIKESLGLNETKAKGVVGEIFARQVMEDDIDWGGERLTSVVTMFENKGCDVTEQFRDKADRGIDDIFVVLRNDGWIDRRYDPVFHEAKSNGNCSLKLTRTKTICDQLSYQWLESNLKKAFGRASEANICFGSHNALHIEACTHCTKNFSENIKWLQRKLQAGEFHRTASVLCPNGTLKIYNVDHS